MPGTPPPSDTGYTDVTLGPDYGFALRESVKEAAVTEPLSPDKSIRALDGTDVYIPMGASFDHTHNDVTRVFDQNRREIKQILWANDENATQVRFPSGATLPITLVHYIPSGSDVDGTVPYHATVTTTDARTGTTGDVMSVSENAWYDEINPTLPRAMCFAGKGCSAGVTAKQQLFLSDTLPRTRGGIPVFSVRQTDNNTWVGTLSILGSTNPADSTSMIMEKNNVDPDQAINFSIISGKWGNETGTNIVMTAKANLTNVGSVLHYNITGTSLISISAMNITLQVWEKNETTGDRLVARGEITDCSTGTTCITTGEYPASDAAEYFVNATILYTLSRSGTENSAAINKLEIVPMSASYTPTITTYYSFGEAVNDYHETSYGNLTYSNSNAKGFYDNLYGDTDDSLIKWSNSEYNYDSKAKSNHWNRMSSQENKLHNVHFAYFSGHGDQGKIRFGTQNGSYELGQSNIGPYTSSNDKKVKWIVFSSCYTMNQSAKDNWGNTFDTNNLHMLLGSDTFLTDLKYGEQFSKRMKGANYKKATIYDAWKLTVQNVEADSGLKGAIYYDDNCQSDYLPGYGSACSSRKGTRTYKSFVAHT